jgi:hypothetical protein
MCCAVTRADLDGPARVRRGEHGRTAPKRAVRIGRTEDAIEDTGTTSLGRRMTKM